MTRDGARAGARQAGADLAASADAAGRLGVAPDEVAEIVAGGFGDAPEGIKHKLAARLLQDASPAGILAALPPELRDRLEKHLRSGA